MSPSVEPPGREAATDSDRRHRGRFFTRFGPGLLVAATGVGAGDLAISALAGANAGVAVLWAVLLGAALKFVLTEGIARWQVATNTALIPGINQRFGPLGRGVLLAYLVPWTFFTGGALMSAAGVASASVLGLDASEPWVRVGLGAAHSFFAVGLILLGGFGLFERVMTACIGLMFAAVVYAAVSIGPDWLEVARGLAVPTIDRSADEPWRWPVALIGAIGGTLTILCYGPWLSAQHGGALPPIRDCRIDLALGYTVTAVFGCCMVILASPLEPTGRGAALLADLSEQVGGVINPFAGVLFLVGAWAAIFSSLLGVWQAVPLLFEQMVRPAGHPAPAKPERTAAYQVWLVVIAVAPIVAAVASFERAQVVYAVFGATLVPLLAAVLLVMNRGRRVGKLANGPASVSTLAAAVIFFGWLAWREAAGG